MPTQTVLVTGATSGIGRETALYLARDGYRVFATGRNTEALAALEQEGAALDLHTLRLDVTDPDSIAAAHAAVLERTGGRGVDALINNAGYGQAGPAASLPDAALRRQFETNVFGLMAVTRAFVPEMIARGRGRVINVSSIGGRLTMPFLGAYHGSKYAVEALSDALRMELRPLGVGVVVIEPGAIKTAFGDTAMASVADYEEAGPWTAAMAHAAEVQARFDARGVEPVVIARVIERALAARRPRARYVAPFYGRVLVFLATWLPSWLVDRVMAMAIGLSPRAVLEGQAPAASAA